MTPSQKNEKALEAKSWMESVWTHRFGESGKFVDAESAFEVINSLIAALSKPTTGEVVGGERNLFNPFPRLVRLTRATRGLTIREMANTLGLTPQRVSQLETDHGDDPSEDEVNAYVKTFTPLGWEVVTVDLSDALDEINEARMTILDSMEKQSTVKVVVQYLDNAVALIQSRVERSLAP